MWQHSFSMISRWRWLAAGAALTLLLGCGAAPAPSMPPAPVRIAAATAMDVPLTVAAVGNVAAGRMVTIKPLIGGALMRVLFTEGDQVKAGQTLFQIDRRPYEAALAQAKANLARDRASADYARDEAERNEKLYAKKLISADDRQKARSQSQSLDAAVQADEAAVRQAELNLQYATIRSPLGGVTGDVLVDEGNIVKANDTALVSIAQVRPIDVEFAIPERYLVEVRRAAAAGPLVVAARSGREGEPLRGRLTFIDNAVNPTTGTIAMKASFANDDGALWPGQYVDVTLELGVQPGATVVPSEALFNSQGGTAVYLVDAENQARLQPVETGPAADGHTVIDRGVAVGDRVIVDGQVRVVPGGKVRDIDAAPAATTPTAGETAP